MLQEEDQVLVLGIHKGVKLLTNMECYVGFEYGGLKYGTCPRERDTGA